MAVGKEAAAVWDGKLVEVYEISEAKQTLRGIGNWPCDTPLVAVYEQSIYTVDGYKTQVRTLQVCINDRCASLPLGSSYLYSIIIYMYIITYISVLYTIMYVVTCISTVVYYCNLHITWKTVNFFSSACQIV